MKKKKWEMNHLVIDGIESQNEAQVNRKHQHTMQQIWKIDASNMKWTTWENIYL